MQAAPGLYYLIDPANPRIGPENAVELQEGQWNIRIPCENIDTEDYGNIDVCMIQFVGSGRGGRYDSLNVDIGNRESFFTILIHEDDVHLWPSHIVFNVEEVAQAIKGNKHDIALLSYGMRFTEDRVSVMNRDVLNSFKLSLYPMGEAYNQSVVRLIYLMLQNNDTSSLIAPMIPGIVDEIIQKKSAVEYRDISPINLDTDQLQKYNLSVAKALQSLLYLHDIEQLSQEERHYGHHLIEIANNTYQQIASAIGDDRNRDNIFVMVKHSDGNVNYFMPYEELHSDSF